MKTKYALFNTVWYDGVNSWIAKVILPVDTTIKSDCIKTMEDTYNSEVVKIDMLYGVTLDDIIAFSNDDNMTCIYDRFKNMFF